MSSKNTPPKSAPPMAEVFTKALAAPIPVAVSANGEAAAMQTTQDQAEPPAAEGTAIRREAYPWKNAPRSKQHLVQLRPSNELFLKLDWLWMHSMDEIGNRPSKHQILIDIIEKGVDTRIAKLIKDGK